MPPLLIFGRTGQVGQALLEKAAAMGREARAIGRDEADLSDAGQVRKAIAQAPADTIVVNAAAYTAVDKAEDEREAAFVVNAQAPGVMAAACAERGLPFIHLSTDYVFDGSKACPYVETDPVAPLNVYGASKRAGEEAVLATGADAVILRTSWVYSPFGSNFVKTMLRVGAERDGLRVVNDQRGGPTSAHVIADAILSVAAARAERKGASGIFHLSGAGEASWAEFAEAIFARAEAVWGRRPEITAIPTSEYPTPARRPLNSRLDCTRFQAVFGYAPPSWRKSLDQVLDGLLAS